MDRDELYLDYQPIVDTLDGRLTGAEALLRWTHPSRGLVSPLLVIPLAERSGQIVEIGQWVLRKAWAERQRWDTAGRRDLAVSVNVSVNQLMAAGFADMVATVLLAGSSDPSLLTLEVTESAFVQDSARAVVVLRSLHDIGVKLALDDFGTGYASLSYLLNYPVHTIKVDHTFVAKVGQSAANSAVVAALIELGHNLGMHVVSEGVETAEQRDELSRLGCDSSQGFYFARPMSASVLDALIHDNVNGLGVHLPAPATDSNA
jgi:EAL domain-containing protein (putative c-di-GMP-specific phosphodiesterase class I)